MALAFLLALQAVAAPPSQPAPAPIVFDLARLEPLRHGLARAGRGCGPRAGGEILVCGVRPRGGDYPLAEMTRRFAPRPIVAETGIAGGATVRAYVEGATLANGVISNRVMVGVRLPF